MLTPFQFRRNYSSVSLYALWSLSRREDGRVYQVPYLHYRKRIPLSDNFRLANLSTQGIVSWPVAKLLEFALGPHHGIIYRRAGK